MNLAQLRRALNALPDRYDDVPILIPINGVWHTPILIHLDEDRVIVRLDEFR